MNIRIPSLLLAAVLLCGTSRADTKVGFIEEFALAPDRERVLAQLVPGSEEFYFYHALHFQNTRQQAKLNDILKQWATRFPESQQRKIIENRAALLAYDADPQATLKFLRERLQLQFNHEQEVRDQPPNLPTSLDPKEIALERFVSEALNDSDLATTSGEALEVLLREKAALTPAQQRNLLSRIERPDAEGLLEVIAADLRRPESKGFGEFPIHRGLLPEQLDALAKQNPALLENHAFVYTRLLKLHPSADVDLEYNPAERLAWLERLWAYAGKLSPSFNTLKVYVLYRRLDHDREQGIYDRARFLEYLKLPRNLPYVSPRYLERQQVGSHAAVLGDEATAKVVSIPPFPTDEPLVRDYLLHLLKDEPTMEAFAPFLLDTYLKALFAEAKIVNGIGNPEQWASLLSPSEFQALKERVDLDFPAMAPQMLRPADDVKLQVLVKNVPSLLVRIYEINQLSFYLTQKRELNTDLNLDGLIANVERTQDLAGGVGKNPFVRIPHLVDFPELKGKRGAWVIEFIGGGKSSRALIRKGQWNVLQQVGPEGDVLMVIDEQRQIVKGAVVWLGGRKYTPDEKLGAVVVPFTNEPGNKPLILADAAGGFATLTQFEHHAESYRLDAQFHIEREQLLSRREATVAIRTGLILGDRRIPISLLDKPRLMITATTLDGVSTTTTTEQVTLEAGKVFTHKFQVPDRLATLVATLSGTVEKLSAGGEKEELSAASSWQVNGLEKTEQVSGAHLVKVGDRYSVEVLGKNGEPLSDRAVSFSFFRRSFQRGVELSLRTDARGRVDLGPLQGITSVHAQGALGLDRAWSLSEGGATRPAAIHARSGELIQVAWTGGAGPLSRGQVSLLERRSDTFAADRFAALALVNGLLEIKGLPPGDYSLQLKQADGVEIPIRVTGGLPVGSWLLSESRFLELRTPPPVQIAGLQATAATIEVQVGNVTPQTRVHFVASRFAPERGALPVLAEFERFTPSALIPARRPNIFVAGRNIGDEYRYILERRSARVFPGNMLPRPGLLLNPWELRTTDLEQQVTRVGQAAAAGRVGRDVVAAAKLADGAKEERSLAPGHEVSHTPSIDFLANTAPVHYNLAPDAKGVVRIDRKLLGDRQHVQVYVEDLHSAQWRSFALPEVATAFRDLRLTRNLDPSKRFAEAREVKRLAPGETLTMADVLASDVALYDSLASVHSLLKALLDDPASEKNLEKFQWLLQWPKLGDDEKRAKYSEFACHELNFFLWRKDPPFFQAVIQTYLANKKDRTFMDDFLLNADLTRYLEPWQYARLNVVEKALLGKKLPTEAEAAARYLRELWEMLPYDPARQDQLFEAALRGRALEESELVQLQEQLAPLALAVAPAPASPSINRSFRGSVISSLASADPEGNSDNAMDALSLEKGAGFKRLEDNRFYVEQEVLLREDVARAREKVRQLFRSLGPTKEWAENNYYRLLIAAQQGELIPLNAFWRDFAAWNNQGAFSSEHLAEAHSSFTEIILALAVLDLPFEAAKHATKVDDRQYSVTAASPILAYHKELREAAPTPEGGELLVTQNFYRKDDAVTHEGNEEVQKYVTGEFIAGVVYGAKVVVSNPSAASRRVQVLLQIPRGALPVAGSKATDSKQVQLAAYSTQTLDYYFYFPAAAAEPFPHYPVTASRDGALLGAGKPFTFRVVGKPTQVDAASWEYISQYGTEAEVFTFLEKANLQRVDLERVAWRARTSVEFFRKVIGLLRTRHHFHPVLWSYAVMHNERGPLAEWLRHNEEFVQACGPLLESPLLTIDPIERRSYQHLEYSPLVNQRAHPLGGETHIVNPAVRAQYSALLNILAHKGALDAEDRMSVVYYLFLQDRVGEALAWFAAIDPEALPTRLQHDFFRCHTAFYEERLADARGVATQHLAHPVPRWRSLFAEVVAQVDEIENRAVQRPATEQPNRDAQQGELAQTEPTFDFKVENRKITLNWANLKEVTVSFYLMDPELLFSSNPFVAQDPERFSIIKPSKSLQQALPADGATLEIPLPEEYQRANVLVEIIGAGQRKAQAYHANNLRVSLAENYGRLDLRDATEGKPVSKAYVKVYARLKSGQLRFYKDGYTDLRGRFDYASLNSGNGGGEPVPPPRPLPVDGSGFDYQMLSPQELNEVDRMAILVLSATHGALTREVSPPAQ